MKKLILALLIGAAFSSSAQKNKVESAALYLRNSEMEDAKNAINLAVEHPDTKTDPKAWFYYAAIYDTIYRNPAYNNLADQDLAEKFYTACKKCIEYDSKERYSYYCKDQGIINSAFMTYSKGISAYEAKDFKNAIKYYQMALDVIPMDKNGDLKKNNLSEKNVYLYMAYAAIQDKDNVKTKLYLQKLMDLNYEDHIIYMQMVNIYLDEKDTATAMKFLESARQKFPTEKDLINQELNIYITQGKQDLLLEKINSAIELNPEDFQLIYVRGNVFDNIASDEVKKAKLLKDSITIYNKKKQVAKAQTAGKLAELAASNAKSNVKKAEADYLKVLELNPDYIDAYFNLGAMSNNRSSEIVEKINNITASTQTEYDKKYKPLKDRQDSILKVSLGYFNSALALAENKKDDTPEAKKEKNAYLRDILYSIQQVYANLGDEKKTIETKKRREAIED
jgi:hypothetical protein